MSNERKHPLKRRRTVYVIDDHPIVREGLTRLINGEPDLFVCGAARYQTNNVFFTRRQFVVAESRRMSSS